MQLLMEQQRNQTMTAKLTKLSAENSNIQATNQDLLQ